MHDVIYRNARKLVVPSWVAAVSLAAIVLGVVSAPVQANPNIVLINADDLGYGDLSCYGASKLSTPNIDRLAREGRRFTDAHASSAVCSPSRYGLLTGRYPLRKNLWGPVSVRESLTVDPAHPTLASVMKKAGYATACIGKWHLGFGDKAPDWNGELKPGPLELGFDHYFGIPSVNSGPPFVYVKDHRVLGSDPDDPLAYGETSITRRYPEKGGYGAFGGGEAAHRLYVDELIGTELTKRATDWLKEREPGKPFFLYLATTNIHHPFTPAERFVGTSECGLYGDFVHELDWIVGEVLSALDEMGARDNTLVIFTSDNGGMLNHAGQKAWEMGHRMNGKLLGFKFGAWEGGHRVPLIVRWPERVPANTVSDHLISQVDFLATFAAIVGQPLEQGEAPDSLNQLATLTESPEAPVRDTLVICPNSPKHMAVRHLQWVYIPNPGAGGFQGGKPGSHIFGDDAALPFTNQRNSDYPGGKARPDAPVAQLYDLDKDPFQTTNVYAEHPEVVRELETILNEYRALIPATEPVGWINLRQ